MPYSFWLLILITCCILQAVVAQVSTQNPLIWQTLVTPLSGTGYDYVANSTVKYYSQDFQTVYSYNDIFGHNERILLNVGDGCNLPTYDDIVYNNNGVSSFVKRQQLMGLVSRGGCSWSTKINNLQVLTQTNSIFKLTGVLIYDNVIYNDTVAPIIQSKPSLLMTPQWHSSQLVPNQRNISMMQDNDLPSSTLSPFMAIYFASHEFGLDMLAKIKGSQSIASTSSNGAKMYIRLAPYFSDSAQEDNPSNSNNGNNGNDNNEGNGTDSSSMDADELFGGGNRGYIAYLVAAVAGIVMAIILFRWCRNPRFGARQNTLPDPDLEAQVGMQRIEQTRPSHQEPSSIPLEKLDAMYPIISASEVSNNMKNLMCAICLDDFDPACQIRLLPCQHGFCVGCIDVWLTKKSSVCPICKHDCCETNDSEGDASDRSKVAPPTRHSSSLPPPSPPSPSSSSSSNSPLPSPVMGTNTIVVSSRALPTDEEDLGMANTSSSPSPRQEPPPYEHDHLPLTSENQPISSHHMTTTS